MGKVTVLDYGMCNMLNVARAIERVGADVTVAEDPQVVRSADRLVVPGVGAFADSMDELTRRGHADAIREFVQTGRPLLGICVGMQVLFDGSDEFGQTSGLGLLPGWVRPIPSTTEGGESQRVPHIGWDHLVRPSNRTWNGTILEPFTAAGPAVYFVHSFSAVPSDQQVCLASINYGGHNLCAVAVKDNVTATQFHPERSGEIGLEMLRQFSVLL